MWALQRIDLRAAQSISTDCRTASRWTVQRLAGPYALIKMSCTSGGRTLIQAEEESD